ncbi:MAG: hypothetical protein ACRDCG_02265 [Mycoplasmoidaceae bacterium]
MLNLYLIKSNKFFNYEEIIEKIKNFIVNFNNNEYSNEKKNSKNLYFDSYEYAGTNINKEKIKEIIYNLSLPPIGPSCHKFYKIYNVEKINDSLLNILSKFIDNSSPNTIGFLITNNINEVPKSIKSRSNIVISFGNKLNLLCYPESSISKVILESVFNSKIEIDFFLNSENYLIILNIYHSFFSLNNDIYQNIDNFKKLNRKEIEILLKLIYFNLEYKFKEEFADLIKKNSFNFNKTLIFDKIIDLGKIWETLHQ